VPERERISRKLTAAISAIGLKSTFYTAQGLFGNPCQKSTRACGGKTAQRRPEESKAYNTDCEVHVYARRQI